MDWEPPSGSFRADDECWPLPLPPQQQQQQHHGAQHAQPAAPSQPHAPDPAFSRPSSLVTNPLTPLAERPADDYFGSLSQARSQPSRLSTFSRSRFPDLPASESRPARPEQARSPSIRIRRSSAGLNRDHFAGATDGAASDYRGNDDAWHQGGRPRSISQPSSAHLPADHLASARNSRRPQVALPRLTEEGGRPSMGELGFTGSPLSPTASVPESGLSDDGVLGEGASPIPRKRSRLARVSRMFWPGSRKGDAEQTGVITAPPRPTDEYDAELVDWLDIIDPEVQTLSTLTNVQNSLFIPDLGNWLNRRPTYVLSERDMQAIRPVSADVQSRPPEPPLEQETELETLPEDSELTHPGLGRSNTITSRLTDSHYAALPHGETLEGWTAADKWELDDHVRHMLHSRRARFKRTMKGFGQYVRRPLGFFVTLYATLITLFGLAWVLFLIGWIYVGEKQVYAIHIIDSVLVALFAVMGDGLAPFRIIDTYHMIFVVRYTRMIQNGGKKPRNRLQKRLVPSYVLESMVARPLPPSGPLEPVRRDSLAASGQLQIPINDDGRNVSTDVDLEDGKTLKQMHGWDPLTPKQRQSLIHHQRKLAKSHSFYKPDETYTHHSFPLGYLMAIVILLDCHSCLQISLGACTWGIDYHVRPFALTTVILCVSITCNLTAGLVITIGDHKTRKKDVVELLNRQELTGDAIKHIEDKKKKEQEKVGEGTEQNEETDGEPRTDMSTWGTGQNRATNGERRTDMMT